MDTSQESGTRLVLWMILLGLIVTSLSACGRDSGAQQGGAEALDEQGYPEGSRLAGVVQVPLAVYHGADGMDTIRVTSSGVSRSAREATPVEVGVSALSSFEVDPSEFYVPGAVAPEVLSFGALTLSDYLDNNLRVCGVNGHQKCRKLQIRMYTSGADGEGLYNAADGYGAPVLAGLDLETAQTLGNGVSGARVVQEVTIPAQTNVLRLSNFPEVPRYSVAVDFSNAGVGDYEADIVIEALLIP
jgi:hypothetical protein